MSYQDRGLLLNAVGSEPTVVLCGTGSGRRPSSKRGPGYNQQPAQGTNGAEQDKQVKKTQKQRT